MLTYDLHSLAFSKKQKMGHRRWAIIESPSMLCGADGCPMLAGVMGGGVSVIAPPELRWEPVVGSSGGHEE